MTTAPQEEKRNPAEPGLIQSLLDGLQSGRTLLGRTFDLATLEARLAALSVVEMLALGVAIGLMAFTIWLLLLAAIAATLIKLGLGWPWTLLLLGALTAVAVLLGVKRVRWLSDNLRFTALRQVLLPATAPAAPPSPLGNPHADTSSSTAG
ncbi:MAG: hypothetical protein RBS88_12040 [Spongiibacteraceae bacterium]|jgi:pheromone shutdown protein TraB|nr:hypothetical protein [Spongiibacteraceae bacterium]